MNPLESFDGPTRSFTARLPEGLSFGPATSAPVLPGAPTSWSAVLPPGVAFSTSEAWGYICGPDDLPPIRPAPPTPPEARLASPTGEDTATLPPDTPFTVQLPRESKDRSAAPPRDPQP